MSALHNWIIDAERYRILLSRHLSPSYFNLCHPHFLPLLILAFKLKMPSLDLFPFSSNFFSFVSILVFSFFFFKKLCITHYTTHFVASIVHRHFILNCSLIKNCTRWLREKAGMKKLHTVLQLRHIRDIPLQFAGEAVCVNAFLWRKKWWPFWKESLSWNTFGVRLILQSRVYGGCTDRLLVTINK